MLCPRPAIGAVAFLQDGRSAATYDGWDRKEADMKHLAALILAVLSPAAGMQAQKEAVVTNHAKGMFDVKVVPQPADDPAGGPFSRLFLDKQFHGELEATSKGQMLGTQSVETAGSGAYVALEHVKGTLAGRRGSFVLQHNGTMRKNVPTLIVTVVPDSATDELKGLAGRMTIVIAGGTHSYDLEYTLEGAKKQE
jgi:hypothetical protein